MPSCAIGGPPPVAQRTPVTMVDLFDSRALEHTSVYCLDEPTNPSWRPHTRDPADHDGDRRSSRQTPTVGRIASVADQNWQTFFDRARFILFVAKCDGHGTPETRSDIRATASTCTVSSFHCEPGAALRTTIWCRGPSRPLADQSMALAASDGQVPFGNSLAKLGPLL